MRLRISHAGERRTEALEGCGVIPRPYGQFNAMNQWDWASKNLSASMAAMQPEPAAVTACR